MMAGVRSVVLCCSCDILLTIVMAGVRSARLEQKREKYLRRRQQSSNIGIRVGGTDDQIICEN